MLAYHVKIKSTNTRRKLCTATTRRVMSLSGESMEALTSNGTATSSSLQPQLVFDDRSDQQLASSDFTSNGAVAAAPASTTKDPVDNEHVAFIGEDVSSIPSKLWEEYGSTAIRLDLSYNKLQALNGVGHFKALQELVLDNNELTDSAMSLPRLPHLHTLTLNNNQLEDTEKLLGVLDKSCPKLRYLSLLGNRACPHELLQSGHDEDDYQKYRYYVLHKLTQLTFLDSKPVSNEERKEAKRVGAFMRVVRPSSDDFKETSRLSSSGEVIAGGYNPLPTSRDLTGQHKGVFGQCKYVYYGKHSEGNRFIRNHHL